MAQLLQPLDANVSAVIEHANLLGIEIVDQMTPLGNYIFRTAAAPPDGHNTLAAKGAAIRTATAGHNAKAACAVHFVGCRLQIGIAIHFEEMIGRPRQRIEVL